VLIEAVGIGLFVSILYYALVGLTPGGLIVPGYIALHLHSPLRVLSTLLAALVTYLIVRHILHHVVILYGRRRFLAMVMVGFIVRWLSDLLLLHGPFPAALPAGELRVIGYIIVGLIANCFAEQGILPTACSVLIASVLVRLVLHLLLF